MKRARRSPRSTAYGWLTEGFNTADLKRREGFARRAVGVTGPWLAQGIKQIVFRPINRLRSQIADLNAVRTH
jgi:hypothetical protein